MLFILLLTLIKYMFIHSDYYDFTEFKGGGAKFSMCMAKVFRCPFKALSYANLSEHGSLDEMNKESRFVLFD